jgi:4-oxalocrotonate tautomerase
MPHVIVKLASGRSEQQKERIAAEVTRAIMATADVGADAISVSIEDYAESEWVEASTVPTSSAGQERSTKNPDTRSTED